MSDPAAIDVFLSYARLDAALADEVERALATAGVRVWRDVTGIQAGWYKERIVAGMRSAKVVVALCSPHSLASSNVAAELDLAWDDLQKPVVSVWAADRNGCVIPDRVLMQLSRAVQYVPMFGRPQADWLADLLTHLRAHGVSVGGPTNTPPPPPPSPPPPAATPLELLDTTARAQAAQAAAAGRLGVELHWTNSLGMSFRLIPPGEFLFGPSDDAPNADPFEAVRVPIRRAFWMATVPLPLRAVRAFLRDPDADPAVRADKLFCPDARTTADDDLPATRLSLVDADAICRWLSVRDGRVYWVPSEVEWECAGRAGCGLMRPPRVPLPAGGGASLPDSRRANGFGLWDVLGNVCEWTTTIFVPKHSQSPATGSPPVSAAGARAVRGAGWRTSTADVRLCWRQSQHAQRRADDLGVRVLCEVNA